MAVVRDADRVQDLLNDVDGALAHAAARLHQARRNALLGGLYDSESYDTLVLAYRSAQRRADATWQAIRAVVAPRDPSPRAPRGDDARHPLPATLPALRDYRSGAPTAAAA